MLFQLEDVRIVWQTKGLEERYHFRYMIRLAGAIKECNFTDTE